jgi:hypothetical protein
MVDLRYRTICIPWTKSMADKDNEGGAAPGLAAYGKDATAPGSKPPSSAMRASIETFAIYGVSDMVGKLASQPQDVVGKASSPISNMAGQGRNRRDAYPTTLTRPKRL